MGTRSSQAMLEHEMPGMRPLRFGAKLTASSC
jgi:hypothetical protein